MKQLYAIRAFGGIWDDSWEHVQYITDDLKKGEAYIEKMVSLQSSVLAANNEIDRAEAVWVAENPYPDAINNDANQIEWQENFYQIRTNTIATLSEDIQKQLSEYSDDTCWDINPVKWLE